MNYRNVCFNKSTNLLFHPFAGCTIILYGATRFVDDDSVAFCMKIPLFLLTSSVPANIDTIVPNYSLVDYNNHKYDNSILICHTINVIFTLIAFSFFIAFVIFVRIIRWRRQLRSRQNAIQDWYADMNPATEMNKQIIE